MPESVKSSYDAVVIGTGVGGSTFAYGLAQRGLNVAVVEKGDFFKPVIPDLAPLHNHNFDFPMVGGQTKSFGAAMYRLREIDFRATEMESGVSPAWPISYADLEPYYGRAEVLYKVHGSSVNDSTEPPRSSPWPHAPIPHQGPVRELVERVTQRAGMPVAHIPRAIDYAPEAGGKCVLCRRCDAYYCPREAKMDAEIAAIRPAVASGRVTMLTNTECLRVLTSSDGRKVSGVQLRSAGREFTVNTGIVSVSGGLRATPLLLYRSRTDRHPNGLSNASGALGRYWASHTQAWVFPLSFGIQNKEFHQKTFAINAYYERGPGSTQPMGVIQAAGNIEPIGMSRRYRYVAEVLLRHSFQTFVMTEALPTKNSGFALADDGVKTIGKPTENTKTFRKLQSLAADMFRAAGYKVFAPKMQDNFHNVGTARMGHDPADSVVNSDCRSHDIEGLFVVDSTVLPTSGALNSGLTIAAVALRAAERVPLNG
jgi:choline dehydrogenase-like flavoprotein